MLPTRLDCKHTELLCTHNRYKGLTLYSPDVYTGAPIPGLIQMQHGI